MWSTEKRVSQRAVIEEGMAAARRWRDGGKFMFLGAPPFSCDRCEDSGLVWWCGKPNEGGRKGPCPRCRVAATRNFAQQLARENFPLAGFPVWGVEL